MAYSPTPIKYYKFQVGGKTQYEALPFLGNTPFGHTEVGEQEFRQATGSTQQFTSPYTLAGGTTPIDIKSLEQSIAAGQGDPRSAEYAANIKKQFTAQGLPPLQGAQQFQAAGQPQQQQGVVPDERAPQGWGIDLATGRFAPLPGLQKTTQPLTQQTTTQDRLLGPTEYSALVKQLGVGPANFDQYFTRKGGDIYLKGTQAPTPQPTAPTTATQQQQQAPDTSAQGPDFKAAIEPQQQDAFTKLKDYLGLSDLKTQQTSFENQLVEAQKNLKTRYDTLQSELKAKGLDEISKKIGDISRDALAQEQALRNLPEAKKQEVAPFKVTAAQLERLTAIDRSKIAQGLSDLVRLQTTYEGQYQRAYQQAKDAADAGVEGAENALKAIGLQVKFATDKREKAEQALKDYAKTITENKKLRGEVQDVITYSQAVKSGYMDISEVPADVRGHVLTEIANPGTFTTAQYNITAIAEGTYAPITDRPLTPAEQNTLKVPSGVSTKSVYGIFGQRKKEKATGGPAPVLPKGFDDDIRRAQDLIDAGRSDWGQEWNALRLRYPGVAADKIDTALGVSRRVGGYYDELQRKQTAAKGEAKPTQFSVEQKTLADIGTLKNAGKTTKSEAEDAIRLKGFDPTKEPWKGLVSGFPKKIGRTFLQRLLPFGK